ncbi:hypothetical protein [Anabaena sp. PCC 7108]|uniref:hypothetical protein n=1 Tax=Anabaena sp. PCC 7108 TaxID=163908 RepID=UPI000345BFC9|nr:hypothetical protein [Anabaena sp. PCC 7108]
MKCYKQHLSYYTTIISLFTGSWNDNGDRFFDLGFMHKLWNNEPQRRRGRREKYLLFFSKLTVTSCTSFNPGHPDSDLIIFCHL